MWLAGDPKLTDWELGQKQSTQDSNQHFDVVSLTHHALSSQNFCNIENYVWKKKKKSLGEKQREIQRHEDKKLLFDKQMGKYTY